MKLLGRFAGDRAKLQTDKECPVEGMGWFSREYSVIAKPIKEEPYDGQQKAWTPNYDSTCVLVPQEDMELCEQLILIPYFDLNISSLPNKHALSPLGDIF